MLWPFKDTVWEHDEDKKSFKLHSIAGKSFDSVLSAPTDLLVGAKIHPENDNPCARQRYPAEFQYCPFCRSKLIAVSENDRDLWIPPYGPGTGLKILSSINNIRVDRIKGVSVPQSYHAKLFQLPGRDGKFAFCSLKLGAKHRLLFALQREVGRLWFFCPDEVKKWRFIDGLFGEDSLPGWSWSMATDQAESGMCLPTDNGPIWLTVDWPTNRIQVSQKKAKSIGAPVRIRDYIFAPIISSDGRFSVVYRQEGKSDWKDCPSKNDSSEVISGLTLKHDHHPYLGIPYFNENKNTAYWSCRGGYISVIVHESFSDIEWKFRAWETDEYPATALIELGPPYRTTGSDAGFWQLCEDVDHTVRDGLINKIIKIDGDELIDVKRIPSGEFITTGRSSFSWGHDYWSDLTKSNANMTEQTELRYPLLQFGDQGIVLIAKVTQWDGRDALGLFTDYFYKRSVHINTTVRLVLEGAGVPERPLFAEEVDGVVTGNFGSFFKVSLARVPELCAFVYNRVLYVHFPENNNCFSWPIEITEKS